MSAGMDAGTRLPAAPADITLAGAPATGTYQGLPGTMDWRGLRGPYQRSAWWRRFHHKRWHYVGLGNAQCFVGLAIVDVGWTNTAFVYVFDRVRRTLLVDASCDGLPGLTAAVAHHPAHADGSWFRFRGLSLRVLPTPQGTAVQVRQGRRLDLDVVLQCNPAQHPMTAIGPISDGGCAHATVKYPALRVAGHLRVDGTALDLDDAWASMDYSNGLLARHTQWRWASAHRPDVGFNLQQGYFGTQENVLWLHGQPHRLGAAQFTFDPQQPLQPWRVHTDDGLLDLQFTPEGARQERKNLGVAASDYIQPIGTFNGTVRPHVQAPAIAVEALLGVTEDHQSTW